MSRGRCTQDHVCSVRSRAGSALRSEPLKGRGKPIRFERGGLVIQALRSLGPEHATPQWLNKLRRSVPAAKHRALLDDLTLAPGWMQPTLRAMAAD